MSYKITKRLMDGINVIGYVIQNSDGKESNIKAEDITKLSLRGIIDNAECILDTEKETYELIIKDNENIENIDKVKNNIELNIVCRLMQQDENGKQVCVGYMLTDDSGKTYRAGNAKAWKLAKNGNIKNARAIVSNNKKVIYSVGDTKFKDMPVMNNV